MALLHRKVSAGVHSRTRDSRLAVRSPAMQVVKFAFSDAAAASSRRKATAGHTTQAFDALLRARPAGCVCTAIVKSYTRAQRVRGYFPAARAH
jgi:hypothetical protein